MTLGVSRSRGAGHDDKAYVGPDRVLAQLDAHPEGQEVGLLGLGELELGDAQLEVLDPVPEEAEHRRARNHHDVDADLGVTREFDSGAVRGEPLHRQVADVRPEDFLHGEHQVHGLGQ